MHKVLQLSNSNSCCFCCCCCSRWIIVFVLFQQHYCYRTRCCCCFIIAAVKFAHFCINCKFICPKMSQLSGRARQRQPQSGHLHRSDGNFPRGVCVIVVAKLRIAQNRIAALHAWETSSKMGHSNCHCLTNVSTLTPDNDDGIVVSRWGNFALTSLPKKSHTLSHLSQNWTESSTAAAAICKLYIICICIVIINKV